MSEQPPDDFDYGERQEDGQYENYPKINKGDFKQDVRYKYTHQKCGQKTKMSKDLAESVARDPEYYTKTFCSGCNMHVPVEEVTWEDGNNWVVEEDG